MGCTASYIARLTNGNGHGETVTVDDAGGPYGAPTPSQDAGPPVLAFFKADATLHT